MLNLRICKVRLKELFIPGEDYRIYLSQCMKPLDSDHLFCGVIFSSRYSQLQLQYLFILMRHHSTPCGLVYSNGDLTFRVILIQ